MFTGITTDIGIVDDISRDTDHSLQISPQQPIRKLTTGASVACDGVCLTVVEQCSEGNWFKVNVSQETIERTTIGQWQPGHQINLERPLCVGDELGGHIVSGHVDGVAKIMAIEPIGENRRVVCQPPPQLIPFLAYKGSVTLNGVSLTINEVDEVDFAVNLIPHTIAVTTWSTADKGSIVNIEIDILARYIARYQEIMSTK